jgi:meiotically up-regulated gene 157 (Mug157) protein
MEALTSNDAGLERELLCVLIRTDDAQRYMHEGFNANDPAEYNRDLFGWANSLFASWVLGSSGLREAPLICE